MDIQDQGVVPNLSGEYQQLYVAFLDLLGFKAQVEAAESDPDAHERLWIKRYENFPHLLSQHELFSGLSASSALGPPPRSSPSRR